MTDSLRERDPSGRIATNMAHQVRGFARGFALRIHEECTYARSNTPWRNSRRHRGSGLLSRCPKVFYEQEDTHSCESKSKSRQIRPMSLLHPAARREMTVIMAFTCTREGGFSIVGSVHVTLALVV